MEPLIYLHTVGPLYRGHIGTLVFTEVLVDKMCSHIIQSVLYWRVPQCSTTLTTGIYTFSGGRLSERTSKT